MSSMFCTKIYQCKNADWCARDFNPKSDGAPKCFEPMTNADRIRRMSDGELALFIAKARTGILRAVARALNYPGELVRDCDLEDVTDEWLNWLKKEAASDGKILFELD